MNPSRRKSIKKIGVGLIGVPAIVSAGSLIQACTGRPTTQEGNETAGAVPLFFSISLAQWSLHRSFFGKSRELSWEEFGKRQRSDPDSLMQGELDPLNFPIIAKKEFGIDAVEYVNQFFFNKAEDTKYLTELKNRAEGEGVKSLLIMCDGEGNLGDLDEPARKEAVENHYKWIDAAKFLGCHSIRVNAAGQGTVEEVKVAAIDGLGRLTEYGASNDINVIVENHGGYSSNGEWLASVIRGVDSKYCGTLPDFGNFCIEYGEEGCANEYDRYKGVKELMPFAKGVSAKSHEFNEEGQEVHTDFTKMLKIVKDAGFNGHIGIEYEGDGLSEFEGIKATKELLIKAGSKIS